MSLGLYDYDRRRRRRTWIKTTKVVLTVGLLLGIGVFAYQIGVERMKVESVAARDENARLTQDNARLQALAAGIDAARMKAEARAAELEQRLAQEVPTGELGRLTRMIAERLNAGVLPERLAFVVNQTQNPRNCQPTEVKRFILPVPSFRATNTSVGFANNMITISGEGVPARNAKGDVERWFDPLAPVTLRFTQIGGTQTIATGALPLHHSVVVGNVEHRFTVNPGQRSFVEVTADRCPFP